MPNIQNSHLVNTPWLVIPEVRLGNQGTMPHPKTAQMRWAAGELGTLADLQMSTMLKILRCQINAMTISIVCMYLTIIAVTSHQPI